MYSKINKDLCIKTVNLMYDMSKDLYDVCPTTINIYVGHVIWDKLSIGFASTSGNFHGLNTINLRRVTYRPAIGMNIDICGITFRCTHTIERDTNDAVLYIINQYSKAIISLFKVLDHTEDIRKKQLKFNFI